jgi:hypothetical protein
MTFLQHFLAGAFGFATVGLLAQSTNPPATNAPAPVAEVQTNTAPEGSLKSFQVIADRNIFNPNRRAGRRGGGAPPPPATKPVKVETFSMVGMISSEKGTIAFFDGSSSDFRKAVKQGDDLGSLKLAEVGHDYVVLKGPEKEFKLSMGMQMKRQDEGEWQLIDRTPSASSTSPAASTPVTSDDDDVVKRMMLNREQESKK